MSEAQVAGGLDRLPWLTDEPKARVARRRKPDLRRWAAGSVLLVAVVSFWLGSRSQTVETLPQRGASSRSTTVAVPEPRPAPQSEVRIAPQPQVVPAPVPEVRTNPVPQVRIAPPPAKKVATSDLVKQVTSLAPAEAEPAPPAEKRPTPGKVAAAPVALTPWQPRVVAGAAGRLVEIGAFGSVPQAKEGWRYMVRTYPAVAHLPAVVRPDRNSKGRIFYRFRIGTTSQAHSEVLCQRMHKIDLSCAVVGLPWKAKVER